MAREFQQAPGQGELWKVGSTYYVAYSTPETDPPVWMTWRVEDDEQLRALVGVEGSTTPDRNLSREQFRKIGALDFGVSAELANFDEDPTAQLERDYVIESNVQPWLKDPEVMAYVVGAIREGRAVTQAELAQTKYWQTHSAAERDWMYKRATDPRAAKVEEADRQRAVRSMLRSAGVSDAPEELVKLLAGRWVSGRWSESFITEQIRGLSDPYGGVDLAPEVVETARGFDPSAGDASTLAQGRDAVRDRVRAIFENRGVEIAADGEDEDTRLDRIADEVMGGRALSDVRRSIDRLAGLNPITGRDITRQGEDDVRSLATRWLGPVAGKWEDTKVREWAGRLRNDPDAETELVELLKQQRLALLPEYTNENLTYDDIITPVRNLATQVWQQPMDDETMLIDLANMRDYSAMQEKLYREGLKRGVTAVRQQFEQDVLQATGGAVRQSAI